MSVSNFTGQVLPTFFDPWDDFSYTRVAGAALLVISTIHYYNLRKRDISVPAVGPSGRFTSYYGAIKFLFSARAMLREGYTKYKGETFKIPLLGKWQVIVSKPELIEEVRKAPDNTLSFIEAVHESLAAEYTLGHYVVADSYHVAIIRTQLTRNIADLFDEIKDELSQAFSDSIVLDGNEWKAFPALETVMPIVCRTSNRVFVGLPVYKDYIDLNIRFTIDVINAALTINMFPSFLQGIAGKFLTHVPKSMRRGMKHLEPIIEFRLKQYELCGNDWPDKPNDMLTWLIEEAQGEQRTVVALTQRMLTINFAAIHTSSMSFTHTLFHLAARPEYIQPIREEVESVIESDGWTKLAMQKMRKLDSFMRETQRYNGIGLLSMDRKALVDYTLSDGTFLPKGTNIACNAVAVHREAANYERPDEFDGFRFATIRQEVEGESAKNQLVATSNDYIPFGHGRHACPGRFFAANELKAMMAYLVTHYDVKLADGETTRPKDVEFAYNVIPNPKAKVMFRKRQL